MSGCIAIRPSAGNGVSPAVYWAPRKPGRGRSSSHLGSKTAAVKRELRQPRPLTRASAGSSFAPRQKPSDRVRCGTAAATTTQEIAQYRTPEHTRPDVCRPQSESLLLARGVTSFKQTIFGFTTCNSATCDH